MGWSDLKKQYCCKHEGKGCPTTTTECSWDCKEGFHNWKAGWSDAKKQYCCKHEGKGCEITTTKITTTTDCAWDCDLGFRNWQMGWSDLKKQYCCKHEGKGCPTTTTECSWDCKEGFHNWKAGWSDAKKQYCCKHESKGCPPTTTMTPAPPSALTCDLFCFGKGAVTVPLPGSEGSGEGAMIMGATLDECRSACWKSPQCEAIVYSNKTKGGRGRSICHGKREIHLDKCQPGGDFFTEVLKVKPWGKCALFGDPHVLGWDTIFGPVVTNKGLGEFYLVKHPELDIHARFGYTARFPTASSTVGIAVGGSMISGHTLVVEYVGPELGHKGFKVFWDGDEILTNYPSTFHSSDHVLTAQLDAMNPTKYHREGRHTIGGTKGLLPSYLFEFKPDLNIYILIGPDNCNAIIQTKKLPGEQDGYCGNFNCNKDDDTLEGIRKRGMADPIPTEESLFRSGLKAPKWSMKVTGHTPSLEHCDPALKNKAIKECRGLPPSETEACVFDACTAKSAVMARQDEAILGSRSDESSYKCDEGAASFWEEEQQIWCCQRTGRGCKETTTAAPPDAAETSVLTFRKFQTHHRQPIVTPSLAGMAGGSMMLISAGVLGVVGFLTIRRRVAGAADIFWEARGLRPFILLDNEIGINSVE